MTEEQINIAIAESLGYKPEQDESGHWGLTHPTRSFTKKGWWCRDYAFSDAPNYYYSLDACAEFEAKLTKDQQYEYIELIAHSKSDQLSGRIWRICSATATQRCEAYLRTIGAWKESNQQPA